MGSVCSHAGLVQSQVLLAQVLALSYTPGAFAGTGPSPPPPIEGKFQKLMSSVVFVNCILNSSLTQHCYHNCFALLKAGVLAWSLKKKDIMTRFLSAHERGSQSITEGQTLESEGPALLVQKEKLRSRTGKRLVLGHPA